MTAKDNGFILQAENVYKTYGSNVVLDDIDLKLRRGELLSVIGPSGCGKSTLLRLILGQEGPTRADTFLINDTRVSGPDTSRGVVYQKYSLFPDRSIVENVALGLRFQLSWLQQLYFWKRKYKHPSWELVEKQLSGKLFGKQLFDWKFHVPSWAALKPIKDSEIIEQAMYYLDRVRLADHAHNLPHQLSGGQQQRVAIAQAMIMRPEILLMDEPFGALDPGTREEMQVFLLELWEEMNQGDDSMTIFFVTHDLEEAVFLGTRLIVLSQFYSDGRNEEDDRGARIVYDVQLPHVANATEVKTKAEFGELIQDIRYKGFDPRHRQHCTELDLSHPDAFASFTNQMKQHNGND